MEGAPLVRDLLPVPILGCLGNRCLSKGSFSKWGGCGLVGLDGYCGIAFNGGAVSLDTT